MAAKRFKLGDDEKLSFGIDWSDWLTEEGAGIAGSVWVVPAELTVVSENASATGTTIVITNNTGVVGESYQLTNIVTLDNPEALIAERSFSIMLVEAKFK